MAIYINYDDRLLGSRLDGSLKRILQLFVIRLPQAVGKIKRIVCSDTLRE